MSSFTDQRKVQAAMLKLQQNLADSAMKEQEAKTRKAEAEADHVDSVAKHAQSLQDLGTREATARANAADLMEERERIMLAWTRSAVAADRNPLVN